MPEYLPKPYTDFIERYPEVARAYEELGKACNAAGPLDAKTRHLVKLGIATAIQSDGGARSHARRALDAGATEDEIRHAVLLALTTAGFPRTVAGMQWVEEVLAARE